VAFAAAGDLDTSFGGDGRVTTDFTQGDDYAWAVAVQSDGKIVTAGQAGGSGGRFALVRYNTNGTLDSTFSGDGKLTTDFTSGDDGATAVAIQSDGKIVAGGWAAGSVERFAVARYNTNGTLDSTFSGDGKVITDFTSGDDFVFGVAIQPSDQKVVVAGRAGGSGGRFALARYNTNGTLDGSFSGDGKLTTDFTGGDDEAVGVAIQSDGKIVAAGWAAGSVERFALARYNTNGTLDSTFSRDGKIITDFTSGDDFAVAVAIQSDGKIVAAGRAGGSGGRLAMARYTNTGNLDGSFSGDGKLTTDFTSGDDGAAGLAIQSDGKIVAAGWAAGSVERFALARYTATGTLDTSFSGDGKIITDFTSGDDVALGVTIQSDGKTVAVGRAGGSGGRFAVVRYLAA
jgi:uncharacterized delta-60 repeat protein